MVTINRKIYSTLLILEFSLILISIGVNLFVNYLNGDFIKDILEGKTDNNIGKNYTIYFWEIVLGYIFSLILSFFILRRRKLPNKYIIVLLGLNMVLIPLERKSTKMIATYLSSNNFEPGTSDMVCSLVLVTIGIFLMLKVQLEHSLE